MLGALDLLSLCAAISNDSRRPRRVVAAAQALGGEEPRSRKRDGVTGG